MNNEPLMRVVVECAAFFALAPESEVDPDAAVEKLEEIACIMKELNEEDRGAFARFVQNMADCERSNGINPDRHRFLNALPKDLGILEDGQCGDN